MKAAVLEEYGKFVWKDVPKPELKDGHVLVRVTNASICGSDQHIYLGEFHPRTPIPFIPGHEFSGVVEDVADDVYGFGEGQKVVVDPIIWCGECPACKRGHFPACTSLKLIGIDLDGGFAEYVSVPASMVFKVDEKLDLRHAALVEILSIGYHACNRSGIKNNDTAVIWGAGKVGQSILQAAKTITTGQIIMVDVLDERLKMATDAYQDVICINAAKSNPVEQIKEITQNKGVDVAFESAGHASLNGDMVNPVRGCIQSIRGAGTVCVLGLADEPAPLFLKELIWKEAKIVASRVSHGEFKEAIENIEAGNLKPEKLITGILHASKANEAFAALEKDPANNLKIILDFL